MKGKSEGDGYKMLVQAAGGPSDYTAYQFAKQLPEKIRLSLIYAGPGTFWTDLEKSGNLVPLGVLKQLEQTEPSAKK